MSYTMMVMQTAKKLLLSLGVIVVFVIYSFQQRHDTSGSVIVPSTPQASAGSNSPAPTTPGSPPTTTSTTYKDGTYVGDAADAFYGTIQVEAIIGGGKITDVKF